MPQWPRHLTRCLGWRLMRTRTWTCCPGRSSRCWLPPARRALSAWSLSAAMSSRPSGRRLAPPSTLTCTRQWRSTRTRPPEPSPPAMRHSTRSRGSQRCLRSGRSARPGLTTTATSAPPGLQRDWFRAHIEIAKRTGKALMIHDRDAHEDVLDILAQQGAPAHVVFHCFSGDAEMAKRCAEAGYVMSFAGNVTFPNAGQLREAAAVAPAELILDRDRRSVPHPGPEPGQAECPGAGRAHPASRGRAEGDGRGRLVRYGHGHRGAGLRPVARPCGAMNGTP